MDTSARGAPNTRLLVFLGSHPTLILLAARPLGSPLPWERTYAYLDDDGLDVPPGNPPSLRTLQTVKEPELLLAKVVGRSRRLMKEKVKLSESTMKLKGHWLEIEHEGDKFYASLRNEHKILGGERTPIARVVLRNLTKVAPGVILKNGPLRFYRTEKEIRISFTEVEEDETLSGYDTIDERQLEAAIDQLLGPEEEHQDGHAKTAKPAAKKPAAKRRTGPAKK